MKFLSHRSWDGEALYNRLRPFSGFRISKKSVLCAFKGECLDEYYSSFTVYWMKYGIVLRISERRSQERPWVISTSNNSNDVVLIRYTSESEFIVFPEVYKVSRISTFNSSDLLAKTTLTPESSPYLSPYFHRKIYLHFRHNISWLAPDK
jgi:hypothetical protein